MGEYRLFVNRLHFEEALKGSFDIGLGVIGYEARSSFCPLLFRSRVDNAIALRYLNRKVRSFNKNNSDMETAGFHIFDLDYGNEGFTSEFIMKEAIRSINSASVSLVVDISSMSRSALAGVFSAILGSKKNKVKVTFTYAIANFERPPVIYPPLFNFQAVSSAFGGAPRGASKSTALILGLGYETGRAITAFNKLEAEEAWVLLPDGEDSRYNAAVRNANVDLLSSSRKINVLPYDINDPFLLYEKIRTLTLGLRRSHRLVFIPSGPKLCALVTFLVAIDMYPEISVWRMSSGPLEPLFHRSPSGRGVALIVDFELAQVAGADIANPMEC